MSTSGQVPGEVPSSDHPPAPPHRHLASYSSEPPSTLQALAVMAKENVSDGSLALPGPPPEELARHADPSAHPLLPSGVRERTLESPIAGDLAQLIPAKGTYESQRAGGLSAPYVGAWRRSVPQAGTPRRASPSTLLPAAAPWPIHVPTGGNSTSLGASPSPAASFPPALSGSGPSPRLTPTAEVRRAAGLGRARSGGSEGKRSKHSGGPGESSDEAPWSPAGSRATSKGGGKDEKGSEKHEPDFTLRSKIGASVEVWKRRWFWEYGVPFGLATACLIAAIALLTTDSKQLMGDVEAWRLLFFLAGLPVIWHIGALVPALVVWGVEKSFFTVKNALYFAYGVRRPLANVVRAALALAWWAGMMSIGMTDWSAAWRTAYYVILRLWACVTLFMTANLLKALLAKILGSKFNRASHLEKMNASIKKEYLLHVMMQPRAVLRRQRTSSAQEGPEEGPDATGGKAFFRMDRRFSEATQFLKKHASRGDLLHTQSETAAKTQPDERLGLLDRDEGLVARKSSRSAASVGKKSPRRAGSPASLTRRRRSEAGGRPENPVSADEVWSEDKELDRPRGDEEAERRGPPQPSLWSAVSGTWSDFLHRMGRRASSRTPETGARSFPPSPRPRLSPGHPPGTVDVEAFVPPGGAARAASHDAENPATPHGGTPASDAGGPFASVAASLQEGSPTRSLGRSLAPSPDASKRPSPDASKRSSPPRPSRALPARSWPAGSAGGPSPLHSGEIPEPGSEPSAARLPANRSPRSGGGARGRQANAPRASEAPAATAAAVGEAAAMLDDLENRLDERPATRVPRRLLSHEGPDEPTREQQELKLVQMEKYIRKHALQITFHDELAAGARSETVTSEEEARRLGFYLFWNLKSDLDQEELTLDDLERFMRPKDARAAFAMFDGDGNGRVSCSEVSAAVAAVFRDRENLAASLADARSVVGSLELVFGGVLHVIMVFLYLVIFGINVLQFYLSFSSLVLAFSFVFQQSLRMIYENAVFLFVIHPYDIGDTLLLDGEQCRVDAINITYTTLTSVTNAQVWYPNEKLRQSQFTNLSESGFKGESLKLSVDLDTPMEVLDSLKTVAQQVIDANSSEYSGSPAVTLAPSDLPFKMTLSIWWSYSHSGIDLGRLGRARTLMYKALVLELVKLGVRYSIPINGSEGKPREQAGTAQNNDSSAAALAAAAHFTQVVATQAGLHSAK